MARRHRLKRSRPDFDNIPVAIGIVVTLVLLTKFLFLPNLYRNISRLYLNQAIASDNLVAADAMQRLQIAKTFGSWAGDHFHDKGLYSRLDLESNAPTLQDLIAIGDQLFLQRNFADAQLWYSHAISQDPESSAAWYRLGIVFEEQQAYRLAASALEMSIGFDNLASSSHSVGISDPYCKLGGIYREYEDVRDLQKAIATLHQGLSLDDFGSAEIESDCNFELATSLRWLNRSSESYIPFYQRAVEINPEHTMASIMLAVSLFEETGDVWLSEKYLHLSISVQPTVRAYQELGTMYEAVNDYEKALSYYLKALEIAETNQAIPEINAAIDRLNAAQELDTIGDTP